MTTTALGTVLHNLRHSLLRQDQAGLPDGELLECFITRRDEAAFETLLRRHGPMVLGVCRRILRNEADAEDAFQATFLVLVRKAATVRPRGMVGNWLYGVAHSSALKARAMSMKRSAKEREAAARPKAEVAAETWQQLQALLDQELKPLPDIYRAAIVLCDLEGQSIKDAARQLGCPQGTIGARLTRGRCLLARRLARRGVTLSGGALATVIAQNVAAAGVPPLLLNGTIKAATLFAARQAATTAVISAKVAALTEGVLKGMLLTKLKLAAALLLAVAVVAAGAGLVRLPVLAAEPPQPAKAEKPAAKDPDKPKTDDEAAKDGFDNEQARVAPMIYGMILPDDATTRNPVHFRILAEAIKTSPEQDKALAQVYQDLMKKFPDKAIPKEQLNRVLEGLKETVSRILKPDQFKRLEQIGLQSRGIMTWPPCAGALSFPDVQKSLKFNDKQKEEVKAINDGARMEWEQAKRQLIMETGNADVGNGPHRIRIHKAAQEKVVELLTKDQKKAWEEMIGDAWDLEQWCR